MIPARLPELVRHYEGRVQSAVVVRHVSWVNAVGEELADAIARHGTPAPNGEVALTRADVISACADVLDAESLKLQQAFVVVMAWGSGKTNNRSLRYTPKALKAPTVATYVLADTARTLQGAVRVEGDDLKIAYESFVLPGVGPSFFTKWFAFAGRREDRAWQPLIFDARVGNTLNSTLQTTTRELNGGRGRRSDRYRAWVAAMHDWSAELARVGFEVTADRLEWLMFDYNGGMNPRSVEPLVH